MALFGKKSAESEVVAPAPTLAELVIEGKSAFPLDEGALKEALGVTTSASLGSEIPSGVQYCLLFDGSPEQWSRVARMVAAARAKTTDGTPQFLLVLRPEQLTAFGEWLEATASEGVLSGLRPIVALSGDELLRSFAQVRGRLIGPDVIQMPISPEVQNSPKKSFFAFSPESRRTVRFIGDLAENGITRIYLLGAPGAGKTSLAYYYYLKRAKGNFVTINLNSESTGDKASMKSLICGHVAGSSPGAQTREGALSFARDGVCFLDESHGATGTVMQVLMEVLENSQFLPFGATAKRPLECAVLFASNRSWETLRGLMHIDEHARLGATVVEISDLRHRREDLIAVVAVTLAKMKAKFTSWRSPRGLTEAAWQLVLACPWRGNVRSLMRVLESAAVSFATDPSSAELIDVRHVQPALQLWEPEETTDSVAYASFGPQTI